ncbi:MAG: LTA synthase family protein, partial [Flavobacterium sp.]
MKRIAHLKPIVSFLLLGLCLTTSSRVLLFFLFKERIVSTENYWHLFPIGLRMDLILLCYLSLFPAVLIALLPEKWTLKIQSFLTIYFIFFLSFILFFELATPNFISQYDTRPNQLFIEYLIYPKEVIGMLYKGYLPSIIATIILLAAFVFLLIRFRKLLFDVGNTPYKTKLLLFPFVLFLLFFGARSSLTSKRPINASNAVFSSDQLTNCLGLNSFYTLGFAIYSLKNEGNSEKMYGKMLPEDAIIRVKKYMDAKPEDFVDANFPLLHKSVSDTTLQKPYNIVIILEESLGAEYVGSLGGLELTPEFDKLTKEGTLFTNMYATGTRSVRGIEAVVTGFLPSPSESVVKLNNS